MSSMMGFSGLTTDFGAAGISRCFGTCFSVQRKSLAHTLVQQCVPMIEQRLRAMQEDLENKIDLGILYCLRGFTPFRPHLLS
jgi:hypothetical protein